MWKRLVCTAILAHASFGIWAASGTAESFPSKPIRLMVGFPPGGGIDYVARVIGPKLTERFGQTVIVENRLGATGNIAAEAAARANPDGYTLLLGEVIGLTSSRSIYPKLGYDLLKDFSYVSLVATSTQVFLANPSVPVNSLSELVALARSRPNAITYGSSGVASPSHLAVELLSGRAKIQLLHVPFKGGSLSITALLGGEVAIGVAGITASLPMIQARRLKALAVSSAKRLGALPDVPTVAESGVPGFDVTTSYGILAPAGTPAAVVKLLNAEIRNILQMDDVRAKFAEQALEVAGTTPAEFKATIEAEVAQWARVIKEAHITTN